jgi:acyl carrier protein
MHVVADSADRASSSCSAGEIVVKSRYLSPGYWNDRAASDAAFISSPEQPGVKIYRTGDLGSIRQDRGLVHLGRGDLQVKISGFRVEIAEVEACLRDCPGVTGAAVVLHTPEHGERELVGFVQMSAAGGGSDVRTHIRASVPAYMVPSEIVVVEEMPCTPNGKVDRPALMRLREEAWKKKVRKAPRTSTEKTVAAIWRQVLNVPEVGVEDNFFELGGNSLLSMALIVKIAGSFSLKLSAVAVLQYPTVRQMAQLIDRRAAVAVRPVDADGAEFEEGTV